MTIYVGSDIILQGTFKNENTTPSAMSTVTLTISPPGGAPDIISGGSITTPSTGVYRTIYQVMQTGWYHYTWHGVDSGGYDGYGSGDFIVTPL